MTNLRADPVAAIDVSTQVVDAALVLARAFAAGDGLTVRADTCPDHAHHIAVEFVHPVIAGARSLPARVEGENQRVRHPAADRSYCSLVVGDAADADLTISAGLSDAEIMVAYHVLWELVQVCLEHPGLVGSPAGEGGDSTSFLYPFLDASESDEAALRASLEASAVAKWSESDQLVTKSLSQNEGQIKAAASAITTAVSRGGRVLVIGNGGSSTDAARIERLLTDRGVDALSLASDYAIITALANDLGADHVFARQIEAMGRPGDVLIGCSTSGASRNLLRAFEHADDNGITGVGISGYGGGAFAHQRGVTHCVAVESSSVHRIQEAQAGLINTLCESVDARSGAA